MLHLGIRGVQSVGPQLENIHEPSWLFLATLMATSISLGLIWGLRTYWLRTNKAKERGMRS
jgi:hypothetical protein